MIEIATGGRRRTTAETNFRQPGGGREIGVDNRKTAREVNPEFMRAADRLRPHQDNLLDYVEEVSRSPLRLAPGPELAGLRGEAAIEGQVLKLHLQLPQWPQEVTRPEIWVLGSAEAAAVSLSRLAYDQTGTLRLQLARDHLGYIVVKDMAQATHQALQIPEVGNRLRGLEDPQTQAFIIYLAREGHLTAVGEQWGELTGGRVNIPATIAHVEHQPDADPTNPFGRLARVCRINFEGIYPHSVRLVIIGDNTASGLQQSAIIPEVMRHVLENNGGSHKPEVLVWSPLLSLFGASAIAAMCAREYGVPVTFVTDAAVLKSVGEEKYFSPDPTENILLAWPQMGRLVSRALGEWTEKVCARGNWTATIFAPEYAKARSEDELRELGTSRQELMAQAAAITIEDIRGMGIKPAWLLPLSTWKEAKRLGKLGELQQLVARGR